MSNSNNNLVIDTKTDWPTDRLSQNKLTLKAVGISTEIQDKTYQVGN
jgi:hypothetical protein